MAISISKSEVVCFWKTCLLNKHLPDYNRKRLGQEFHQYFKLEKITNEEDKIFCDRLYEMDGEEAMKAIELITDYLQ